MDIFEAILTRHAVKAYQPDFVIPPQDEQKLFELTHHSPTSYNIQNWRFVIIRDKNLRADIRKAANDQAQVTEASLLIILCADIKAWEKNPERYWAHAPQETRDFLVPMIGNFYRGHEQLQRDEAIRSIGIAAQTMMLAAKGMGYDTCPMIGFDADAVAKLINLPQDHVIGMMMVIGKTAKPVRGNSSFLPQSEVFIDNRFGE